MAAPTAPAHRAIVVLALACFASAACEKRSGTSDGRSTGAGGGAGAAGAPAGSGGSTGGGAAGTGASGTTGATGGGTAGATGGSGVGGGGTGGAPSSCDSGPMRPWAIWPMPSPPSAGLPHPQSYTPVTVGSDAMVQDDVTGLLWQRDGSTNPQDYDWEGAAAYCASLVLGGYCDWRLPSRIELVSLVDYTKTRPMIDTVAFPNTQNIGYWSASGTMVVAAQTFWAVSFGDASTTSSSPNSPSVGPARCVRGGRADVRPDHYTVGTGTAVGTIQDNETGLTWQREMSPSRFMFGDSSYCDAARTGGFDDWRLPTIAELQTIVDDTRPGRPYIDTNLFPTAMDTGLWTSTSYVAASGFGWYVHFGSGTAAGSVVANMYAVRCVR